MITSAGPICDVCGRYILPTDPEERVMHFSLGGLDMHAHKVAGDCFGLLKRLWDAAPEGTVDWWAGLPDGPLRQALADACADLERTDDQP